MKTIKFYGVLAKKFGKEFQLDVASVREVMRALSVQLPGFEKFMLHAHEHGLAFAVWQDKRNIAASEIDELVVTDTIPLKQDTKSVNKIRQLSVAPLLAETISRITKGDSVMSLFAE